MITNLVTLCYDTAGEMRVIINVLPDDIEGGLDIPLAQDVEETRSVTRMRTVIESHRDVRLAPKST